jgi:tRNA (guanine-N7-)-methyltransferase
VRKPKRLSADELAPYVWELPPHLRGRWGNPAEAAAGGGHQPPGEAAGDRGADAPRPPGVEPIDWAALFGNANPVEVEVGFGKGLFLVTAGTRRPDRNFFGVEIIRKYQLYAATRVAGRGLRNVRTCCGDAKLVLREFVRPGSVAAVHVYFPDPWWKNRHRKRLLFTPEFAGFVLRALVPGGELHFVTDVADYFAMVTGLLAPVPGFDRLPPPDAHAPAHDMDYLTNFERKFRKEGRPIHRALYRKREG